MPEVNWSAITALVSAITAIIAIIAPALVSIHSAKSQERLKRMEIHEPRVYDALAEMAEMYAHLSREHRSDADFEKEYHAAMDKFYCFSATCYKVMTLIPDKEIQAKIATLISDSSAFSPSVRHDTQFNEIMADITAYLQKGKKRRNALSRKRKT